MELEEEERSKGLGFMKRLKDRWDAEFPENTFLTAQNLRDNAARMRKEDDVMKLKAVRKRGVIDDGVDDIGERLIDVNIEVAGETIENDTDRMEVELMPEDAEVEKIFLEEKTKLENVGWGIEKEREKLSKLTMTNELIVRTNRVLKKYLTDKHEINDIVDAVYAMGRTVMKVLGVHDMRGNGNVRESINRRERKKVDRIKELRQWIARIANELHRRKERLKSTNKEKKIMKELRVITGLNSISNSEMIIKKEEMLDEMRYHQISLQKIRERAKRIKDNKMFIKNEGVFYRDLGKSYETEGVAPDIERFVDFWANIWEEDTKTPLRPWMQDIQEALQAKVVDVQEFEIEIGNLSKIIKKRKNWTAPGIDGIQNYWWKKFHETWPPLVKSLNKITNNPNIIPEWFPLGKTVLLPKTKKLDVVGDYRPITCLNTVYKIFTGVIASFMKDHAVRNNLWDDGQLGAREGVLGTVDQLLVDECIMQQVREKKRNLAVAFYDYRKAYDMVHHDWMIRVYEWMGVPSKVCNILDGLMRLWKTKLEVYVDGQKQVSRWISIMKGFLQGDSYSPVGFCLTEVPIGELISLSKGYVMGGAGRRNIKRTHSLFIDDLKVYASSHENLKLVNETIVKASSDTGALYGVKKCAEAVYKRGKMVKGEGLEVLEERMQALDPDENEFYKFLGCEQTNGIDVKKVLERVKKEMSNRLDKVLSTGLSDKNMVKALNTHVLPVAGYVMNMCKISETELNELDMIIKRKLREKRYHGRLSSDERLYMHRKVGGRGLKSLRELYKETKTRIACYLILSGNRWMNEVWKYEKSKDHWSIKKEVEDAWKTIDERLELGNEEIILNGQKVEGTWKVVKEKLKRKWKEKVENNRKANLVAKNMQGKGYNLLDRNSHLWLQCNVEPQKVGAIIEMQERMVETRAWKQLRNIDVETVMCRLCGKFKETLDHILAGCEKLAGNEYMKRHNNALMVMATEWAKINGLVPEETKWYMLSWKKGTVLENNGRKLIWDFEFRCRKSTSARRPDLVLEDNFNKTILIIDMACPMEQNIEEKRREKLTKYQQIAYEIRERRRGYRVRIVPLVIGCLGGGGNRMLQELKLIIGEKAEIVLSEMTKVVLWEGESLVRKVMSGLIQEDGGE